MSRPAQLVADGQARVIELAMKGYTDKEICRELNLAMTTVRTHWVRVRRKTGTTNRAQLVAQFVERANHQEIARLQRMDEAYRRLVNTCGIGVWEFRDGEAYLDKTSARLFQIDYADGPVDFSALLHAVSPVDRSSFWTAVAGSESTSVSVQHSLRSAGVKLRTDCAFLSGEDGMSKLCMTRAV